MKIYKVTFDCQMKEMPLIMHPFSTYVEATSEHEAVRRGWLVVESNDENMKKLNISCADVREVEQAKPVNVFLLSGNNDGYYVTE